MSLPIRRKGLSRNTERVYIIVLEEQSEMTLFHAKEFTVRRQQLNLTESSRKCKIPVRLTVAHSAITFLTKAGELIKGTVKNY